MQHRMKVSPVSRTCLGLYTSIKVADPQKMVRSIKSCSAICKIQVPHATVSFPGTYLHTVTRPLGWKSHTNAFFAEAAECHLRPALHVWYGVWDGRFEEVQRLNGERFGTHKE